MERLVWTPTEVVDVDGPRAMLRAYPEQRDVRAILSPVLGAPPVPAACDLGCGFGRLTPVLTELAREVIAFEHEPGLLAIARHLQPDTEFRGIDTLSALPAADAAFDLGLVFTVLQRVPEPDVLTVIAEIRRILRPSAWLAPWRLVTTRRRIIEPHYPRPDVGTYMLFAGPTAR